MTYTRPARASAWRRRLPAALALATCLGPLAGCAPLLVGGAILGTGLVISDRRSTGAQLEDRTIASKAESHARGLATLGRINVHSYNRLVLITGEVPTADDKARVEQTVSRVENVRSVVNELQVGANASASQRTSDGLLEGKVKAALVDAKELSAATIRVIAERGQIYLMGRVTEKEANAAAETTRAVSGVVKVVRVFEVLSEQELQNLSRGNAPTGR